MTPNKQAKANGSAEQSNDANPYRESEEMLLELRAHAEKQEEPNEVKSLYWSGRLSVPFRPVRFYGID